MSLLQADLTLVLISTVNIFIAELLFKDVQAFLFRRGRGGGRKSLKGEVIKVWEKGISL